VGIKFAQQNQEWISKQQQKSIKFLYFDGMPIGKKHRISLIEDNSKLIRIKDGNIIINKYAFPDDIKVKRSIKRALNLEAKEILPERVNYLANLYGFQFNELTIKPMKTRWGACSNSKNITLNCYLMMLPWNLIDYVILHELVHTIHMNHSDKFWSEVEKNLAEYKQIRKELRIIQPQVHSLYI
jgi:predicted metal-dependent hydrolase